MDTWNEIKSLALEFNGPYKFDLTRQTKIEDDLHITGDDARDFIQEFIDKFSLKNDEFEISKYFYQEGFDPLRIGILLRKIFKSPIPVRVDYDLTLGGIENWAKKGYWEDPIF